MSGSGILARWAAARAVVVVPMGGIQFVPFDLFNAVGTRDLGGCSVVIIASIYGVIMAHIPPRPPQTPPDDGTAGANNARYMMSRVAALYQQHRAYFPSTDTIVFCAWHKGTVGLPDQLDIMRLSLQQMGLNPIIRTYHAPGNRNIPGQGTAIIIKSPNSNRPHIYLEDHAV